MRIIHRGVEATRLAEPEPEQMVRMEAAKIAELEQVAGAQQREISAPKAETSKLKEQLRALTEQLLMQTAIKYSCPPF